MIQSYVNIRVRRDSSSDWSLNNPTLKLGEPGLETDTRKLKFGDGSTSWNSLPYINAGAEGAVLSESIDDRVADLLIAGPNIQLSYNDNNNALTIGVSGVQPSGSYATLDGGKIPSLQLPSYVDDVLEYSNLIALPVNGESGKIYVTLDNNKTYRWSGSTYIEISPSPGSTDSVIEGSTNLYFTNTRASSAAPVQSVAGKTGVVTLSKTDVNLDNVDNTSDANKPISSATQTALDAKAPIANPTFTGTVGGITKSMVGLGNVDNTSDADKPISTATQTALNGKQNISPSYLALGSVSSTVALDIDSTKQVQTLTLSGSITTFTKGTGWPANNTIMDLLLIITVSSATTIVWSIVTDWYNQPTAGALSTGTHIFLLRAIGSSTIQGHYIGNKTN